MTPPLGQVSIGRRAPVRIVHLGLGAFSRSHLAWYTGRSDDAGEWGISAYTGRSRALADALSAQDGLYTLIERDDEADHAGVISSIVRARSGDDLPAFLAEVAAPTTAIVSLTITERGYRVSGGGHDTADPAVVADDRILRDVVHGRRDRDAAAPTTALGRLLLGLATRRALGSPPLTVLSLDNLPDNGAILRGILVGWASSLDPAFGRWVDENASFPSSSVDRITPRLSDAEHAALAHRYDDRAPVVAEGFSDWVVSGDFPAGRPAWETAGVRFVEDLAPWEARKLWMLNGAHTLLACLGLVRGHSSVAGAIDDPVCRDAVDAWWEEAARHLPAALEPHDYARRLVRRFSNGRIEHQLAQIATDSQLKLSLRVAPVAEAERRAGRTAGAGALAIAAWITARRDGLLSPSDEQIGVTDSVRAVSAALAEDDAFVAEVTKAGALIERVPT